jgi:uncharacterized phage protein (TIGR01671 family)
MREIKFRAWGKNSKEFLQDKNGYGLTLKEIQNIADIDLWEFQQFTGIIDKNGKEIYEGDVVKTPQQKYIKQWVVEYDYDGNLILSNQINSEMSLYDFEDMILNKENCYIKDIEVIGNIFENPELIK